MLRTLCTLFLLLLTSTGHSAEPGFKILFDGTSLDGWKHAGNWEIQDDKSVHRTGPGGSLTYINQRVPDDFELSFEWKVGKGANSGIYYRPGQYEYQILHNQLHRDGQNPRTSAASLYFCMAPSHDATRRPGQWNSGRVICKGSVIQHWLNGEKVIDFDYRDPKWAFNLDLLKKRGADLASRSGQLSLQDHGDPVWYRNIKIREVGPDENIRHKTVIPEKIGPEVLEAERKKLQGILERREQAKNK